VGRTEGPRSGGDSRVGTVRERRERKDERGKTGIGGREKEMGGDRAREKRKSNGEFSEVSRGQG
jgi:hypothetical protein